MFVAWQGSRYAGWGAALVGCSLLAAGLARLILPPRYAGLLSTRRKASDVLAFAVFGAAVHRGRADAAISSKPMKGI